MKYEHILVRFGELNTKGKNKIDFINTLYRNMKRVLKKFKTLEFLKTHDHIYITLNEEDTESVIKVLKEVSGIANFSLVKKCDLDEQLIASTCLEIAKDSEGKTFKVKTRRANKSFPTHSDDMNRLIATEILKNTDLKVDVHSPDILFNVEIRNEGCFISTKKILGAGGYPLGVGGKALVLLSGGIDSPVASYLMMKRGVNIEAVHFASPPYTSKEAQNKVVELLKKLSVIKGSAIKLHIVPFTSLQEAIYDLGDESYAITLMRRMMYRIAQILASRNNCKAIATGESVGQVASQTLESIKCINETITMPVIRPLACMDKTDIIDISKRIDTYDISILPFIDCCTIFTPKNPVTHPKSKRCEELEAKFDYKEYIYNCVKNTKHIYVDENYTEQEEMEEFL